MAGGEAAVAGDGAQDALRLVRDIGRLSAAGFGGAFKRDCTDLSRRVALLAHLLEEIMDLKGENSQSLDAPVILLSDLTAVIQAAKRLLSAAGNFDSKISSDGAAKKISFQFQCVTWKLEKALENIPYDHFDISEEVQEQVELVRAQLRRANERFGAPLSLKTLSRALSEPLDKDIGLQPFNCRVMGSLHVENIGNIDHEVKLKKPPLPKGNGPQGHSLNQANHVLERPSNSSTSSEVCVEENDDAGTELNSTSSHAEENKKPDSPIIPDDFRCPISLELMRDPVIVSTGQTYERSYIQRWIDCGNTTCPKHSRNSKI